MSTINATTPTRTFTAKALDAELSRRSNNQKREVKAKPRSFVFPALTRDDIENIKAGGTVVVNFRSGRTEVVALKA